MSGSDRPLVVVGMDDSPDAAEAARWAIGLLAPRHPRLRLVHIPTGSEGFSRAPDWLCRQAQVLAAEVLVDQPPPGCATGTEVAVVLADLARDADLLVVGSYGVGSGGGVQVGSTALELLDRAPCPLAVVRGPRRGQRPSEMGPVAVGYDGSPTADVALALAATIADLAKTPLRVICTWSESTIEPAEGCGQEQESWELLAERAAAVVDQGLRSVTQAHPELEVQRHVLGDTPLRALLDVTRDARLVVVGQRRSRPEGHRRRGSTSHGLVEFGSCPVLVVPPV